MATSGTAAGIAAAPRLDRGPLRLCALGFVLTLLLGAVALVAVASGPTTVALAPNHVVPLPPGPADTTVLPEAGSRARTPAWDAAQVRQAPEEPRPATRTGTPPAPRVTPTPGGAGAAALATPADTPTYKNCAQAGKAGATPLRSGDPGYSLKLDRDGDGVACEEKAK